MRAIEIEAAMARLGASQIKVKLITGEAIAPCKAVSVSSGIHGTLWISTPEDEIFLALDDIETMSALSSYAMPMNSGFKIF